MKKILKDNVLEDFKMQLSEKKSEVEELCKLSLYDNDFEDKIYDLKVEISMLNALITLGEKEFETVH